MARNYLAAERELAPCLGINPESKPIKRKLIICYTQLGNAAKALEMFNDLINQDIEFIISADEILDDCPCPELLNNKELNYLKDTREENFLILGILWLYCSIEQSMKYFKKALELDPDNDLIKTALDKIENYFNSLAVHN
jgi:pentatricopeptide repeat protein